MALYLANGNVYVVNEDGQAHPADVTAKDKVIETRQLESVTVKAKKEVVALPDGAMPVTQDELVCKFNLSQKNPIKFDPERAKAAEAEEAAPEEAAPDSEETASEAESKQGEAEQAEDEAAGEE